MGVAVISFLAFGASQVATPGPANMAMLTTGAAHGFRAALPFEAGVVLGKQLIIWPLGFGLLNVLQDYPGLFTAMKYASAAYIFWLAWRVAHSRLPDANTGSKSGDSAPSFWAGLIVHPLNPKAWAMVITGLTGFVSQGTPTLQATATIAMCLLACQLVFHPIWALGGDRIASAVKGHTAETFLMYGLAGLTVLSVLFALWGGEIL